MLRKGPFNLTWRGNTILDVESLDISLDINSEKYEANSGRVIETEKSTHVFLSFTLLATDIASLAIVLPQFFVPFGEMLSTGEIVSGSDGAIDYNPYIYNEEFIYVKVGNKQEISYQILSAQRTSHVVLDSGT